MTLTTSVGENDFELSNIQNDKVTSKDFRLEIKDASKKNTYLSEVSTFSFIEPNKILYLNGNDDRTLTEISELLDIDESKISYYDTDNSANIPYSMDDLASYDEIIMDGFDVMTLDENLDLARQESIADQFVTNLNYVTENTDTSLVTIGETYSSTRNSDYEYLETLDLILPNQSDEPAALIFLVDVSGSMDTYNRLTMAKKGAIAALDTFSDEDMVGITTFSDETKIVKPLTSIRNKEELARAINKMKTEGGTTMGPALRMCGKELNDSTAKFKTIITLSDGKPFDTDASLNKIVRQLAEDNITCSFINISNSDSASASRLERLATYGNGNYYFVSKAQKLVHTMVNAVTDSVRAKKISREFDESSTPATTKKEDDVYMSQLPNTLSAVDTVIYTKSNGNDIFSMNYPVYYSNNIDEEGNSNSGYVYEDVPIFSYKTKHHGSTIFSIHTTMNAMNNCWGKANLKSTLSTIVYQSLPCITK